MNRKGIVAGIALAVALSAPAFAGETSTPRVEKRQIIQQDRIGKGIASGELTPKETIQLEKEQAHIERVRNQAVADGVVTPKERVRLHNMQDRASRTIYRKKHNHRVAK